MPRSNVLKWDELNILRQDAELFFDKKTVRTKAELERFCDYMEFVLCLVYAYGWKDAEEIVGIVPFRDGLDDKAVNLEIDGKTFRDRITEDSTVDEVIRIIDTEAHRDYNTGVYDAAKESGIEGIRKKWHTMMDDRVRDPHAYMEGMEVGLDDMFYTYTGDSTLYPGGFGIPDLDINCRCFVTLIA